MPDNHGKKKQEACTLRWLLMPWLNVSEETRIDGMTLDSRTVKVGDLFVAVQGAVSDGRRFIDRAIEQGACVVLSETTDRAYNGHVSMNAGTTVIHFFELNLHLSSIAMRYYFPQHDLHSITGITGTNGKTTIATLLANSYMLLGQQCAQMGTIGNGLYGQLQASSNTTLDAISVCRELKKYQQQGAQKTCMEVSSHGLLQGRVSAIPFTTAIFTNLTRDHLDYHGTMAAYEKAKKMLFEAFPLQNKIINADDAIGQRWLLADPTAIAYGLDASPSFETQKFFKVTHIDYLPQGIRFDFVSSWGEGTINAPFYGNFNVSNIAALSCALLVDDFSLEQIIKAIAALTVVPGRMEQYLFKAKNVTFVVDYAHTPDALKNALSALQHHKKTGRIIAVFGCGGDRDKGKRAQMGACAEQYADHIVIVDDNPRNEDPTSIVADILVGLKVPERSQVIHDRRTAIEHILATAKPNDIVLLAGKGHEDYQIFGDQKVHYSDRECVMDLQEKYNMSENEQQEYQG